MSLLFPIFRDKKLLENVSFIAVLQVFNIVAPLITYPYLVRVLGMEEYGVIITAQVLVGYFSIFILFGSDSVCAKHVSINRDNARFLSSIYSTVLISRAMIWLLGFLVFLLVIYLVPFYRSHFLIFLISYGMTFQDVLFPQYLFQGLEKMKFTTIVNVCTKLLFIFLVFITVKKTDDIILVPILYSAGYLLGGLFSFIIVVRFLNIRVVPFSLPTLKMVAKDSLPIFGSDLVLTIKDRFNVLIMGNFISMSSIVVFDFSLKIVTLLVKPAEIIRIALFPRAAKYRSIKQIKKVFLFILALTTSLVVLTNVFLPQIVALFLNSTVELFPIRLFSIAPIFITCGAYVSSNVFVAFGYNKYVLTSIIVTTVCYIVSLLLAIITHHTGTVLSFMIISLLSYMTEFLYRVLRFRSIIKERQTNNASH